MTRKTVMESNFPQMMLHLGHNLAAKRKIHDVEISDIVDYFKIEEIEAILSEKVLPHIYEKTTVTASYMKAGCEALKKAYSTQLV